MRVPKAYQINSSDKAQTRVKHLIHFFVVQWRKFTFKHSPHSFCTISFASKIALVSIWLDWHFFSIETTKFVTNIPSRSLGHFHFVILVTLIKLKFMKILSFFFLNLNFHCIFETNGAALSILIFFIHPIHNNALSGFTSNSKIISVAHKHKAHTQLTTVWQTVQITGYLKSILRFFYCSTD